MAGPFATATEFCEWTGLAVPTDLARLQALLDSASTEIRGVSGQTLSQVVGDVIIIQPEFDETTGRRNPPPRAWGDTIYLPQAPVTAISSIVVDAVGFSAFGFTSEGVLYRTDNKSWTSPATITYSHGYAESSEEFKRIRTVCIEAVKRAYTADEGTGALAMGGVPMETVGFPLEVYLTEMEKQSLPNPWVAAIG
jgi:hypothetical protein